MKNVKNKNLNVINYLNSFFKKVVFKNIFYIPFTVFTLIAYGFNLFNRSVSVDDMGQAMYYGEQAIKLKGLRWGEVFFGKIFSTVNYTPFINRFVGLIFFVIATVLFISIFYYFDNKKDKLWKYSIVACIFITYPLINEFWEYDISLYVPLELSILEYGLLYILINQDKNLEDYLLLGLLFTPIMAGYESPVFAYVSLVILVLLLEYGYYGLKEKGWILEGLSYAYPLIIALILRFVIGYAILFVTGLTYVRDGASSFAWLDKGFVGGLLGFLTNGWYYLVRALSYKPITEFVIVFIIFVGLEIKNIHKKNFLLLSILYFISLFFLSLMQGASFGYRTAQTIQYFICAIVFLLFVDIKSEKLNKILTVLFLLLCLRQSVYLHQLLALNNQRSDNELSVVRNIGYELYSKHDISKEVYFVGKYSLGDDIESQIYVDDDSFAGKVENYLRDKLGYDGEEYDLPIVSTNVSSCFNWAIEAPWYETIKNYFSYCGYDLNINIDTTSEMIDKYYQEALDNNLKPLEILEKDNYIIVFMG